MLGQNVTIEYRWAEGQYDRVPVIALELVDRRVAVLVANTPGVLSIKGAITTTPIVFTTGRAPVQISLVASMSRPAGNITGATALSLELVAKRLEPRYGAAARGRARRPPGSSFEACQQRKRFRHGLRKSGPVDLALEGDARHEQ